MVCGSCHSYVIAPSHEWARLHVSIYSLIWTDSVSSYRSSRRKHSQHIVLSIKKGGPSGPPFFMPAPSLLALRRLHLRAPAPPPFSLYAPRALSFPLARLQRERSRGIFFAFLLEVGPGPSSLLCRPRLQPACRSRPRH